MTFATLTSVAGLLTAALLLGACQQSSTGGSGPGLAAQEKTSDSQAAWEKRRCCHRAGRTNSR